MNLLSTGFLLLDLLTQSSVSRARSLFRQGILVCILLSLWRSSQYLPISLTRLVHVLLLLTCSFLLLRRKTELLKYFAVTRARFLRLLALLRWAATSPQVSSINVRSQDTSFPRT